MFLLLFKVCIIDYILIYLETVITIKTENQPDRTSHKPSYFDSNPYGLVNLTSALHAYLSILAQRPGSVVYYKYNIQAICIPWCKKSIKLNLCKTLINFKMLLIVYQLHLHVMTLGHKSTNYSFNYETVNVSSLCILMTMKLFYYIINEIWWQ